MNTHEKCSFRSGWLTRHMDRPCVEKHGEDRDLFKQGFEARKRHGDDLDDPFETMMADERSAISQEVRRAA